MLLDDQQVAISELIVAYQESIDHNIAALERIQGDRTSRLLKDICNVHMQQIKKLSAIIKDLGELPRAPNADREQLQQLFTHTKAILATDERAIYLSDRISGIERLLVLLQNALNLNFSTEIIAELEMLQSQENEHLGRLNHELALIQ